MRIDTDVEQVLVNSSTEGNLLFLPQTQLERSLYMKVNKILTAIGGKWSRSKKAHIFDYDPSDAVDQIILTGEFIDPKKEFQFFETPKEIASQLVELSCVDLSDSVLEPSAGNGRIADAVNFAGFRCDCVEINPKCREQLEFKEHQLVGEDFLQFNQKYDVIVANPPFSKQQDIDHVNHMLDLANKTVVSIMSSSVLWRDNKKTAEFRDRIESLNGEFIELPDDSFKESGTRVKTCIVKASKA